MSWKGPKENINRSGRKKGSKNKNTEQIRNILQEFLSSNLEDLQSAYDELAAKEKLSFIERVLKHVLPAPLHPLEKLTDAQLDDIIIKLKKGEL